MQIKLYVNAGEDVDLNKAFAINATERLANICFQVSSLKWFTC